MIGEFVSKASVIRFLQAAIEASDGNTVANEYCVGVLNAVLAGVVKMPTFVIREDEDDEYE